MHVMLRPLQMFYYAISHYQIFMLGVHHTVGHFGLIWSVHETKPVVDFLHILKGNNDDFSLK